MSTYMPQWSSYGHCPMCGATTGEPCLSLLRKDAAPITHIHPNRPYVRPYAPQRQPSKLAKIVLAVMAVEGLKPRQLSDMAKKDKAWGYRTLSELYRPITLDSAVLMLSLMGYELQHRAVRKDEVEINGGSGNEDADNSATPAPREPRRDDAD